MEYQYKRDFAAWRDSDILEISPFPIHHPVLDIRYFEISDFFTRQHIAGKTSLN
jgi:hypothetical protein